MPLTIKQENFPKLSFQAEYESAPLKAPIYYSVRIGFNQITRGWEAELNHLKIYLKNESNEIQRFSVSHGYNQLFVNRIMANRNVASKIGFGCVIAHPENTIRNLELNQRKGFLHSGYYLSGLAIQYSVFKELYITSRINVLVETSATFAYAIVPVSNGTAQTPVFGLHLKAGPGYYFIKKKNGRNH